MTNKPCSAKECIQKILTISTAHITEQDNDLLKRHLGEDATCPFTPVSGQRDEYGFWVWVPEDDRKHWEPVWRDAGFSPDLVEAVILAKNHGCRWLHLDADADMVEELAVHDW